MIDLNVRHLAEVFLGILLVAFYLAPFYLSGENTHISIFDNLESPHVITKLLVESGMLFSHSSETVPGITKNGLPRIVFGSEFTITNLFYSFLAPYWAYIFQKSMVHLIAYVGMYLFIRNYFKQDLSNSFAVLISATFALTPFWSVGSLSVAGIPVLALAFYFLRLGKFVKTSMLIAGLFPFFSSFYLSGYYLIFAGLGIIAFDWNKRRPILRSVLGLAVFISITLIVEYRVILWMIDDFGFISHRESFQKYMLWNRNFPQALLVSTKNFIFGQGHTNSLQLPFLFPAALFALIFGDKKTGHYRKLWIALIAIISTSLCYGFWYWEPLNWLKSNVSLLRSFNASRVYWSQPFLWSFVLSLSVICLKGKSRIPNLIIESILVMQIIVGFHNSESATAKKAGEPTYGQFFDVQLFDQIKRELESKWEAANFVSIGIHPSVAQYNGLTTADFYHNNYPLEYKGLFRQFISKELDKSRSAQRYYDFYGNKVYVMPAEIRGIGYLLSKTSDITIERLELNAALASALEIDYVLSAVRIENFEENNLTYLGSFEHQHSFYRIFLYTFN